MSTEEHEKRVRLMLRQLTDAQMQAEKILSSRPGRPEIESFARYCTELNEYIRRYAEKDDVVASVNMVPEIEYTKLPSNFLQYMFTSYWWQSARKRVVMEQVRLVREKYAMLELQLRGMTFDK